MHSNDSEFELIQQAREGDQIALSHLLFLHYDELERHIAPRIPADLESVLQVGDVVQLTFVKATKAIATFVPLRKQSFAAWLKKIAERLIIDAQRRRNCEHLEPKLKAKEKATDSGSLADLINRLPTGNMTPSGVVANKDTLRVMQSALATLSDEHRDVLERYYLKDQTLQEIAEALGTTKGAVRAMCYRARKDLHAIMGRTSLYFDR